MTKKNRQERAAAQKKSEEKDRTRAQQEQELRAATRISAVIFLGIWLIILVIVWGNGWFGPGK